jgi:ankyrin repeat protein
MSLSTALKTIGFLDARDEAGNTLLHYAVENMDGGLLKEMVKAGAAIDAQNNTDETPLIKAVEFENYQFATYLLNHGASVDMQDDEGYAPLHYATIDNDVKMAKLLLRKGASVHTVTEAEETPLHHAVRYGYDKLVLLYLDYGANINQESECGTPMFQAIGQGRLDMVDFLLERGADIDRMDPDGGRVEHALQLLRENIRCIDDEGSDWESDDGYNDHLRTSYLFSTMSLKMEKVQEFRNMAKTGNVSFFISLLNIGVVPPIAQVFPLMPDDAKVAFLKWAETVRGDMRGLYALFHGEHGIVTPSGPISSFLCSYLILPARTRSFLF